MTRNFFKILTGAAICAASTVAFASNDNFNSTTSYAKPGFSVGIDGGYGYLSSPEASYPNGYNGEMSGFPMPLQIYYHYTDNAEIGDFVWGAHIGYDFKIKPDLLVGFELGYKDLGHSSYGYNFEDLSHGLPGVKNNLAAGDDDDTTLLNASRNYNQNAVDLLLTTHYYIFKGLNIFGKAGLAYVRSNVVQSVSSDEPDIIAFINPIPLEAESGDNTIWRFEPEVSFGVGYTFNQHFDIHAAYTYIGGANDQPIIDNSINSSSQRGDAQFTVDGISSSSNTAMYLPTAKVYSTNMITAGISYTF